MSIKLNRPYKIARERHKRYESHYNVPAGKALVVPVRKFDHEVSCDIRWEDEEGRLHVRQNKVFTSENLVPLNALLELDLYELWEHYYAEGDAAGDASEQ